MNEIEEVFRKDYMFSREDLISAIEQHIEYFDSNDFEGAEGYKENCKKLFAAFLIKIKKAHLPTLRDNFWYYEYSYTGYGLELHIAEGSEPELDENKEYICSMSVDNIRVLFSVPDTYISETEFAKAHDVELDTVDDWIKHGQLKYAKFEDGEWLIPSTNEKPDEDEYASYIIDVDDPPQIDEFPMICMCETVSVWRDAKGIYYIRFINSKIQMNDKIELTKEEAESFEYELIKSGKAICEPPCQIHFNPFREVSIANITNLEY